jgi:hypothetical protein
MDLDTEIAATRQLAESTGRLLAQTVWFARVYTGLPSATADNVLVELNFRADRDGTAARLLATHRGYAETCTNARTHLADLIAHGAQALPAA